MARPLVNSRDIVSVWCLALLLCLPTAAGVLRYMSGARVGTSAAIFRQQRLADVAQQHDVGEVPSVESCSALCLADSRCSAFTWFGAQQPHPWLRPLSRHCVLSEDINGSTPRLRSCGIDCNQYAGQRVISPWPTDGYDSLQTLWFGANETGLDLKSTLQVVSKHSLAGYSWMQGLQTHSKEHSELAQAVAAQHARDYLDGVGNSHTTLFVYRQVQIALGLFDITRDAASNPDNNHFWLHAENDSSVICYNKGIGSAPLDPYWNFSNAGAREFWLDEVIQEVCDEHSGFTTVYFDEVDDTQCGYWRGGHGRCPPFSNATLLSQTRDTYAMFRTMVQKLNDCGIIPIMATFTLFKESSALVNAQNPCLLWEDELVAALDGLQWARFYEQWPDTFNMHHPGSGVADRFAQVLANGILEAKAGIPVVAHTTPRNDPCVNVSSEVRTSSPLTPPSPRDCVSCQLKAFASNIRV